jgi:2-amino-4-hydroxy-6-hydroxymethyldihydropteridine diphosphokinase
LSEQDLKIPRDEIMRYTFVLYPLAEIAGQLKHPVNGMTYNELWLKFDDQTQPLQRIDFQW